MEQYNPQKIESKWQKKWEKQGIFQAKDFPARIATPACSAVRSTAGRRSVAGGSKKPKKYILFEFPYPSGDGLHVGHCRSYCALDAVVRKKRMEGYNVLFPIGWDAFGLPAENYAIKTGVHPKKTTAKNIANFKRQYKSLGISLDWDREINTTDPKYYKWTQWIFLKLFENGLAYQTEMPINWCPSCKIGLANEEVVQGKCERCGAVTEKKQMKQWMLKITKYADRLIDDLEKVDYPEEVKTQQINWIGKSEGAEVNFSIVITSASPLSLREASRRRSNLNKNEIALSASLPRNDRIVKVFTTRADTLFGCTYIVVCPEHEIIKNYESGIMNYKEVKDYLEKVKKKSDLERTDLAKEKTGVELKGIKAINPVNNKEISIWAADYVLPHYGAGAIMAVPAHDERDFEFAKKFNLPIKQVVSYEKSDYESSIKTLKLLSEINKKLEEKNMKAWLLGGLACAFYANVIYRKHEDLDLLVKTKEGLAATVEVLEELNFKKAAEKKIDNLVNVFTYRDNEEMEVDINCWIKNLKEELVVYEEDFEENKKELLGCEALVLSKKYIKKFKDYQYKNRNKEKDKMDWEFLNGRVITEDGFAVNSGQFDGLTTKEFKEKITKWLEEKGVGRNAVNYKLRDWVFSRQHYWGEPIPLIFCNDCEKLAGNYKSQITNHKFTPTPKFSVGARNTNYKLQKIKFNKGEVLNPGWVAVPEKDLPVELPYLEKYQPSGTGKSPLSKVSHWVNVKCPRCGARAKRETDTMPNWAGSSWYFIRYIDPRNDRSLADPEKLKYWLPVDWYNGGMEHTTLHLLYSRFWYKFLFDIGIVPQDEPYQKRTSHGMVLAKDGRKMSKSLGNVINPDDIVKKFGADSLRLYEMFMGPYTQAIAWNTKGVVGMRRFLERVWKLFQNFQFSIFNFQSNPNFQFSNRINRLIHQTIKKVTGDIENLKFNTAISQMMVLVNEMEKEKELPVSSYQLLLKLLSPFAPHISEELWQKLGHPEGLRPQSGGGAYGAGKKSIFLEKWPKYDPKLIKEEKIILVIQVNGKVRDKIEVGAGILEDEAKKLALSQQKVLKYTEGKTVKKVIFIKGRLVNIVC